MAWPWKRLSLLQRFTVVSAVIAIALAVTLSAITVRAIESSVIRDEAQVAAELVLRTISEQLRPVDFKDVLPANRRKFLDSLFRAHGVSDRMLRIRLWRSDGKLLYSNVTEQKTVAMSGVDFTTRNGYEEFIAYEGRVENTAPGVVRFFVPVLMSGSSKPLAAFEIFYDLAHLNQQLSYTRRAVWTAVPIGFLILYGSVFVLVSGASRRLLKQQADLIAAHLGTYQSLASAIDAKDSYTGDHSLKVAEHAARLARTLGLSTEVVEETHVAARLHDLGKIGVPDSILTKSDSLSPEEWVIMRKHAQRGFEILEKAPLSKSIKLAILHSHERWDGKGYPNGVKGDAIPMIARIVAVVDAYEAMTSDRPYRKALPVAEAMRRLERSAGSQFDPDVARAFVQIIRDSNSTIPEVASPAAR